MTQKLIIKREFEIAHRKTYATGVPTVIEMTRQYPIFMFIDEIDQV